MLCEDIENELPFICICQLYEQLRKRYIPDYYYERSNMYHCIELMFDDDANIVCLIIWLPERRSRIFN